MITFHAQADIQVLQHLSLDWPWTLNAWSKCKLISIKAQINQRCWASSDTRMLVIMAPLKSDATNRKYRINRDMAGPVMKQDIEQPSACCVFNRVQSDDVNQSKQTHKDSWLYDHDCRCFPWVNHLHRGSCELHHSHHHLKVKCGSTFLLGGKNALYQHKVTLYCPGLVACLFIWLSDQS